MSDTIVLFSSARRNGNTGNLLDCVSRQIDMDVVDLSEYNIGHYDYEYNQDDDFLPLINRVLSYQNIVFASPVYWYSVTPVMKAFIDRISDLLDLPHLLDTGRQLRGKTGYVLCSSISEEVSRSFIDAFKDTFDYLGMSYGGHLHADCADGYQEEMYRDDIERFLAAIENRGN